MRIMTTILALALLYAPAGCGKPANKKQGKSKAGAAMSAPWKVDMTMDCPSYVRRSKTEVKYTSNGVTVRVTTSKSGDVARIRKYARYAADAARRAPQPEKALQFSGRTGNRTHNCPVVLKGARITTKDVSGGALLEIAAKDPKGVSGLQQLSRKRLKQLRAMQKALEGLR